MILASMVRYLLMIALGIFMFGSPAVQASTNRVLVIERSSTQVSVAKATLSIAPLVRNGTTFAGKYEMKVNPFFFKGETGELEIVVSDDSLAKAKKGEEVEITGTALTHGENTKRKVNARATPSGKDCGALKVWFVADGREMVFQTSYKLVEQ
jgi:hypothetical protein